MPPARGSQRKVTTVGLDARVEHVIASGELGIVKPDPRIFHHACDVFGVLPAQAVYVGDRLRTDAIGAASAGLTGVWLNRTDAIPSPDDADEARRLGVLEVASLDQLADLLAR